MVEPIDIQQEAINRKEEAVIHWEAIKSGSMMRSRGSLVIGFHAQYLKKRNLWGMLGFRNEHEAREAADISESGWYGAIQIAEAFQGVPEETFCAMKQANAEVARDLPDSKRLSEGWLRKAIDTPIKEFKRLVDEEMNGKTKRSDSVEHRAVLKADMPASQKKAIEKKVVEFAEAHGIEPTDTGTVLEAVLTEATDGDTLTGALLRVIDRARKMKELVESGLSSDEVMTSVIPIIEDLILDVAKSLGASGAEKAA